MRAYLKLSGKLDANAKQLPDSSPSKVLFSESTYFIVFASVVIIIFFIFDSCMSDIDVIICIGMETITPIRLF